MTCECCGREVRFVFPVLGRNRGFIDDLDRVCCDCAELVNDEYYCGSFRSLVPLDVLFTECVADFCIRGSLVA